jgi:hypothetical protein
MPAFRHKISRVSSASFASSDARRLFRIAGQERIKLRVQDQGEINQPPMRRG